MVFVTADYVDLQSYGAMFFTGVRLLAWYLPVGGLLLFQPDFGTVLVLFAPLIVIIFVSGAPALQYAWILFMAIVLGGIAAWLEPYRRERRFYLYRCF